MEGKSRDDYADKFDGGGKVGWEVKGRHSEEEEEGEKEIKEEVNGCKAVEVIARGVGMDAELMEC